MSFLSRLEEQYSELWRAIIRPPRDIYELKELGPNVFSIENKNFQRTDLWLTNPRGFSLACSHFEPVPSERPADQLPCVVYLHGNCSSRLEAITVLPVLLPFNITVFCLDFAGSGLSDGEYLSLGYYERDDLAVVVNHLRESNRVTCVGLWGRSMGATTALLHADRDPSIAGLVLDSPFSDLKTLCEELVDTYTNNRIPRWLVGIALHMVRNSIKQHASFDINDLSPIQHVKSSFIPALFTAAQDDNFILPHHTKELHQEYAGDKNFVMVDGDHNSQRSKFFMDSVAIFFFNTLQCEQLNQQCLSRAGSSVAARSGQAAGRSGQADARPARGTGETRSSSQGRSSRRGFLHMRAPERRGVHSVVEEPGGGGVYFPATTPDAHDTLATTEEDMIRQAIRLSLEDHGRSRGESSGHTVVTREI